MSTETLQPLIGDDAVAQFRDLGFHIARNLFNAAEVAELNAHFTRLHDDGVPGKYEPDYQSTDPLGVYPRLMHPHRFDDLSKRWLLDARVVDRVAALAGEATMAAQSMYYWKPPLARGQELHQDNFYLQVEPRTCIAAWTALDRCDVENGGLKVVPNTGGLPIQCPESADLTTSFTNHYVRPPAGCAVEQLVLEPGDTLFFNGNLIHGSGPNLSRERFRRAFICHYVPWSAREVSGWFFPLLDRDGQVVERTASASGGPCGVETKAGVV